MQVIIAEHGGFCRGVQRAVDTAMTVDPVNTYILGELIHNPTVTKQVSARGIVTVDSVSQVPEGATLILRSHGVAEKVYRDCAAKNIKIIDCTCPFVRHTQKIVASLAKTDKTIVIVGEKTHPEVVGLNGWCGENAVIIDSPDFSDFSVFEGKNVAIVSQTTFS